MHRWEREAGTLCRVRGRLCIGYVEIRQLSCLLDSQSVALLVAVILSGPLSGAEQHRACQQRDGLDPLVSGGGVWPSGSAL